MFKPFKSFKTVVVAGLAAILMLPGSARAGEARADWQAEWEKTVQAAKREGKLALYLYQGEGELGSVQISRPRCSR